jgi:hypothetical protein
MMNAAEECRRQTASGEQTMYVLRRIFKCKPGEARRVASLVQKQAEAFEEAGQRSECRVYFNGYTTPSELAHIPAEIPHRRELNVLAEANLEMQARRGPQGGQPGPDTVVLEWTDEVLRSTFRAGLTLPQAVRDIGGQVAQLTESNRLEIMELMTPDKMMDV